MALRASQNLTLLRQRSRKPYPACFFQQLSCFHILMTKTSPLTWTHSPDEAKVD